MKKSGISYDFLCASMSVNKNPSGKNEVLLKKIFIGVNIGVILSVVNYERVGPPPPLPFTDRPLCKNTITIL